LNKERRKKKKAAEYKAVGNMLGRMRLMMKQKQKKQTSMRKTK